jgi:hypothetical protein
MAGYRVGNSPVEPLAQKSPGAQNRSGLERLALSALPLDIVHNLGWEDAWPTAVNALFLRHRHCCDGSLSNQAAFELCERNGHVRHRFTHGGGQVEVQIEHAYVEPFASRTLQ